MFDSSRFVSAPDLPPILAVNANVHTEEIFEYWLDTRKQRFLTPSVDLHVEAGEGEEPSFVTYNLRVSSLFFLWAVLTVIFQGYDNPSTQ
jgi:hypothetical protein